MKKIQFLHRAFGGGQIWTEWEAVLNVIYFSVKNDSRNNIISDESIILKGGSFSLSDYGWSEKRPKSISISSESTEIINNNHIHRFFYYCNRKFILSGLKEAFCGELLYLEGVKHQGRCSCDFEREESLKWNIWYLHQRMVANIYA